MQKSTASKFLRATARAASSSATQATAQTLSASHWQTSGKPLMRMRIRVNCAGVVQTSRLSSVKYFHTSRNLRRTESGFPSIPLENHSTTMESASSSSFLSFSPQVHSYQGDNVLLAGSNSSYESLNADRRSRLADEFSVGQVSGPSNTTFSKYSDE